MQQTASKISVGENRDAKPQKKPSDNFQASEKFAGPKPGFLFKASGPLGPGYYKDLSLSRQQVTNKPVFSARGAVPTLHKSGESALDTLRLLRAKEAQELRARSPSFPEIGEKPKKSSFGSKLKKRISKTKLSLRRNTEKPQSDSSLMPPPPRRPPRDRSGHQSRLEAVCQELGLAVDDTSDTAAITRCGNILLTTIKGPSTEDKQLFAQGDEVDRLQMAAAVTTVRLVHSIKAQLGSLGSIRRVFRIRGSFVLEEKESSSKLLDTLEPVATILAKIFATSASQLPVVSVVGVSAIADSFLQLEVDFELM